MSACDQRSYYPAQNGLFKLRAADGDLVWECRPISYGTRDQEYDNGMVDRLGNTTIVAGTTDDNGAQLLPKAMFVEESGGLVQSLDFTEDPAESTDDNGLGFHRMSDRTDEWLYLAGGRIVTPPNYSAYVVNRFDLSDLSHMEGTVISSANGDMAGFRAVQNTAQFDIIRENLGGLYRYTAGSTVVDDSLTGISVFFSIDRNFRIPSDGTHYYLNAGGAGSFRRYKVDIATLSVAAFSTIHGSLISMAVRDGYLGATSLQGGGGNCAVVTTGGMSTEWNSSAHFSQGLSVDVCGNFSVFVGLSSGTTLSLATSFRVIAFDHAGTPLWSRDLQASTDRSSRWHRQPFPVISQDESKVYVYGPLSHDGIGSGALKMAMYCLDATNGDILWCFSGGPNSGAVGDGGAGMSLYDEGDYVYLGTQRCRAPLYR
jgi:hypothetical protein